LRWRNETGELFESGVHNHVKEVTGTTLKIREDWQSRKGKSANSMGEVQQRFFVNRSASDRLGHYWFRCKQCDGSVGMNFIVILHILIERKEMRILKLLNNVISKRYSFLKARVWFPPSLEPQRWENILE
jgi:hypothetical protein